MRAGNYRHRVTLQVSSASTANTYGETTETWTDVKTGLRAEVRYLGATESVKGKLIKGEATVMVTMRYRDDVNQESRLKHGTHYLYVMEVLPDTRNREIICTCREVLT